MRHIKYIAFVMVAFTHSNLHADIIADSYLDTIVNNLTQQISGKANTGDVVKLSGTQTVGGAKTFSDTITSTKSGVILDSSYANVRSSTNPYFGLFPSGQSGSVKFYLQASGSNLYLGPTSSRALAFEHDTGNITMPATLNVQSAITTNTDVASGSNNNTLATTKWTNTKIDGQRSTIRTGGVSATTFGDMWVE